MTKEKFEEELKANKHMRETYYILSAFQNEDEETIILVDQITKRVSLSFKYSEKGLIWAINYGDVGIRELRETLDAIIYILDKKGD